MPFAWDQANLALLIPSDWSVSTVLRDDLPALEIANANSIFNVLLLPDTTPDEEFQNSLDAAFQTLDLSPTAYAEIEWFGQQGLSAEANNGVGRIGRLPDRRTLLIVGRDVPEVTLNTIANSIVFSAQSSPTFPSYTLLWSAPFPQITDAPPNIVGLAYSSFGQLYALEASQGILVFDPATGDYLATYPFLNPAQPNSIAVDSSGMIYVGDTLCRCVQRLANRNWLTPIGSFSQGAPFHLNAAPDGTLYTIDRVGNGYGVRIFAGSQENSIPLDFNSSVPPFVAVDGVGQVQLIEWLRSLIDNQINGAVSQLQADSPSLQYWLTLPPDAVSDIAVDPANQLFLALSDGRVVSADAEGNLSDVVRDDSAPRSIAFAPDGTLFIAHADGTITTRSPNAPPERTGDGTILQDIPVQGRLNETLNRQEWRYEGTAGDQMTISAVDLTRTDALDMAVRLIGPDGGERDYNDDQLGLDLYGRFDAQIADFVVRETGTYTIAVEWVQGDGTYTLGVSTNRRFELNSDTATRLEGKLQDVFPVQRWIFEGQAGQVVTFTMFGESGNLDPALELIQPGGSTLAYNDDAADPDLGVNAQLFYVELPDEGIYVLKASRFEGSGDYSIVGVVNR